MDLESLVAIDVHTHAEVSSRGGASLDDTLSEASAAYFKIDTARRAPTLEQIAAYYRERDMMAVVFTVDAEHATGIRPVPHEEVAEAAAASGGVLIPFASIDPFRGKAGVAQARALAERYGVKGFKFHPSVQGFYPNDRMACGLFEPGEDSGWPCSHRPYRRAACLAVEDALTSAPAPEDRQLRLRREWSSCAPPSLRRRLRTAADFACEMQRLRRTDLRDHRPAGRRRPI